jgi:hypothetical protein
MGRRPQGPVSGENAIEAVGFIKMKAFLRRLLEGCGNKVAGW